MLQITRTLWYSDGSKSPKWICAREYFDNTYVESHFPSRRALTKSYTCQLDLESLEALIQRRECSPPTNVAWVRFWPWRPMWVELNGSLLGGLFLKIHETFRVSQLIPFISSHRQGSKLSTFTILLVFLTFVSMLKHQLFKTSRLKFDNWLFWARKVVGTFERALGPVSRKSRNFSGAFRVT